MGDHRFVEIAGTVQHVYLRAGDGRVVITGIPPDEPEDSESAHNCDAMGCAQEHVLLHAKVEPR